MSDSTEEKPYLWILVLSLFLLLLSTTLLVVCHRACGHYCICRWCCVMDVDAYRRERDSLHRLRELRRLELQRHANISLATFSQIPGPIPDSFVELRQRAAFSNLHSLGFILVTPAPPDVNSMQQRDQLTDRERRDILERVLSCRVRIVLCDLWEQCSLFCSDAHDCACVYVA